jgi:hypothetical protein
MSFDQFRAVNLLDLCHLQHAASPVVLKFIRILGLMRESVKGFEPTYKPRFRPLIDAGIPQL